MNKKFKLFFIIILGISISNICMAAGQTPARRTACEKSYQDYRARETLRVLSPLGEPLVNTSDRITEKTLFVGRPIRVANGQMVCKLSTNLEGKSTIDMPENLKLSIVSPPEYNKHYDYYITTLKSESGRIYKIVCKRNSKIQNNLSTDEVISILIKNQMGLDSDLEYENKVCAEVDIVPASGSESFSTSEEETTL